MERPNVLIVEDEAIIALSLQIKLEAMGYAAPTYVPSGEAALQAISEHRPDIVLMDILLAGQLTGIETATQIQTAYDIPVIYITAHPQESLMQQAKTTNPVGYLLKPFRDQDLRAAIEMGLYKYAQERLLREAEKALRESEERLKLTVRAGNVGLWDWNLQTNVTFFSPEWKRQIGYLDHEITDDITEWQSRIHPADLERCLETVHAFIENPWPDYAMEFRLRHKDGSYRWILAHADLMRDEDGKPARMMGSHVDITERKRIELELEKYRQHLEELVKERTAELEQTNDLLSAEITERKRAEEQLHRYADEQAALVAVTSAASAFLEPDELLSAILEVVMAISDIQADAGWVLVLEEGRSGLTRLGPVRGVSEKYLKVENTEPLNSCPICATWLEGVDLTELPPPDARLHVDPQALVEAGFQSHIVIPLSVSRRMLGVIALGWRSQHLISADRSLLLSIGRQVGLALRNAQLYQAAIKVNRLEAINKISAAVGSTLELDIVLQQVLEKACQTLEAETGAVLLTTPNAKDLAFAYILPGSLSIQSEQRIPIEKGIIGWVVQYRQVARINDIKRDSRTYRGLEPIFGPGVDSLMCAPLIHRDKFTGVIAIFNKLYGEFSQEDANLLEAVSSISATALDNARLYEDLKQSLLETERAQAQLIQSEKIAALGRLAASVAHEINNPLQAVQGCLSLLVEELSGLQRPDKMNSYLGIVDKEIERVAGIVHSMRDFARPALQGTRPTDILAVLEEVLKLAGKQLQHSRISVERSWGVDVPTIQANPDLLKQVFLNMILNAIDAMSEGGTLRVSANTDQIKITDNPQPQPAVRLEFSDSGPGIAPEVLSRLFEPFFTTKEQGSGLGLYISYTIIQSLNGKIEVSSAIGRGTTFAILLPLERGEG